MFQSPYLPLATLSKINGSYNAGFCKWYYTPIQNLDGFPTINPANQCLAAEPNLKNGCTWYGPVNIPNRSVGFDESLELSAAGGFYKAKVSGNIAGNNVATHINLDNMRYHKYCVVGKLRAGGLYLVIGTNEIGLAFDYATASAIANDTPGTKLSFAGENKNKSLVLTAFSGGNSLLPVDAPFAYSGSGSDAAALAELINFNTEGDTTIEWTSSRKAKYGLFPTIEVWAKDADTGKYYLANLAIEAVGEAPNFTAFTIRNGGGLGYIKIM